MDTKFYCLLAAFLFMPTFISCADKAALESKVQELTKDLQYYEQQERFDQIRLGIAKSSGSSIQAHLEEMGLHVTQSHISMTVRQLDKAKEALAAAKK